MIFKLMTEEMKVIQGYAIASAVLSSDELLEELSKIKSFTYSEDSGEVVATRLCAFTRSIWINNPIPVEEYFYESESVVATTFSGNPGIFVNRFNFWRFPKVQYARNGAHEITHKMGYGHGSNWTQDNWKGRLMCKLNGDKWPKSQSVPYVLEELVLKLAKAKGLI